jgi:hypothetical protein
MDLEIGRSLITDVFLAVNIRRRCADEYEKCTYNTHMQQTFDASCRSYFSHMRRELCVRNSVLFSLSLFSSHILIIFSCAKKAKCARDWTNRASVFFCTSEWLIACERCHNRKATIEEQEKKMNYRLLLLVSHVGLNQVHHISTLLVLLLSIVVDDNALDSQWWKTSMHFDDNIE